MSRKSTKARPGAPAVPRHQEALARIVKRSLRNPRHEVQRIQGQPGE